MTEDVNMADAVRQIIDECQAQRAAAAARRRTGRAEQRQRFREARNAGLRARHAAKQDKAGG